MYVIHGTKTGFCFILLLCTVALDPTDMKEGPEETGKL